MSFWGGDWEAPRTTLFYFILWDLARLLNPVGHELSHETFICEKVFQGKMSITSPLCYTRMTLSLWWCCMQTFWEKSGKLQTCCMYRALNKQLVGLSSYPGSIHLLQASISSFGTVFPSPGCWRVPWGCENESLCSGSHYDSSMSKIRGSEPWILYFFQPEHITWTCWLAE